ncbi:MAG: tyrosine-type recombinase/integrase [Gemmatimonadales bacterium]
MSDSPKPRRAFGTLKQFGTIWWVRYRVDGKERWQSLKTTSREKAEKGVVLLEDRLGRGEHQAPDARRLSFADLETMLRTNYRVKGNRSLDRMDSALAHLRKTFEGSRALGITAQRVTAYELARLDAGASRSTVNYELALLRRAFRLAVKDRRLPSAPAISTPAPRNARTGFFEPGDFAAVLAQLPEPLKPVMQFAYYTGWRVRSEVLTLQWSQVDFAAGIIRLEPNTTKNDEGRSFPFDALPDLAALLEAQRAARVTIERQTGTMVPWVFHRVGAPIKSYVRAWAVACERAARGGATSPVAAIVRPSVVGRLVHDFRRTAVRNLVRAGVPDTIAMRLTGHKTRSVFDRYDITNEADLRAGVGKLAVHMGQRPKAPQRPQRPAAGRKGGKGTLGGPRRQNRASDESNAGGAVA